MLAGAFGFESAVDYGRANEATLSRLRAQARLFAREVGDGREMGAGAALAKVNAFVSCNAGRNAADRARRVRLRRVVSAAETAAAQNEPLADEQQRVLDTSAPHTPSHQHAAQQQLKQQWQRKWLSAFDRKWGFQPPDRKAAWESAWELRLEGRRCFKAQRRWRFFLKWPLIFPDLR